MKKIINQGLDTLVNQVGALVIGMASSVLLNRILGPEQKGMLVSFLLIPQSAIVFSELGLGTSGAYQLSQKKHSAGSVVIFLLAASLVLGITASLFVGLVIKIPDNLVPDSNKLAVLSIIIPGLWLTYLPEIYLGLGDLRGHNRWKTGYQGLRLILIAVFLFSMSSKIEAALWANVTAYWLAFIVSIVILVPEIRQSQISIKQKQAEEAFKFGFKVFLGEVLGFLHYRLDIYLILYWMGNFEVGIYSTAVFLSELIWMIPRSLYAPVFAELSKNAIDKKSVKKAAWLVLGITSLAAVISIFLIDIVIKVLYGASYAGSVMPFILLLPGTVMLSIPKFLEAPLIAELGAPEVLIQGKAYGLLSNIILNIWLIPGYGLAGAAAASSISYTLQAAIFIWLFKKKYTRLSYVKTNEYALLSEHESSMNEIPD